MAFSRTFAASLLLSLLLLHLTDANQMAINMDMTGAESPQPMATDCGAACEVRCQLSSRPRLCNRACTSCCEKCNCVPPGTSGNYEACPCYCNLTTRNLIRKCP